MTTEKDNALALTLMISLLDAEWRQATDGFALTPSTDNWTRMMVIMHARQRWAGMTPDERSTFMADMLKEPIMKWIKTLYDEQLEDMKTLAARTAVKARHEAPRKTK